ncbi:MAG: heme ABC exporter ATP-binding protein CcmA [bacterium]
MNLLEFSSLTVGYDRKSVLNEVEGEISSGEWVHLWGRNGSGKTSLLQVLASFHQPLEGEVLWNGTKVRTNLERYRRNIRYFGHEVALFERLTVRDNWELFGGLFNIQGTSPRSFTGEISPSSLVQDLSRGQKRRVELASLIASPRDLVILDEPFASLDEQAIDSLRDNLQGIREDGGIVVTASPESIDGPDRTWQVKNKTLTKLQ